MLAWESKPELSDEGIRILDHAIRHIRRNYMSRAWTLSSGDEQAVYLLENLIPLFKGGF